MKPKILSLHASLRNGRWGRGVAELLKNIKLINDKKELFRFIHKEGKIRFEQFIEAGRKDGLAFDETYRNLRKSTGMQGLCNSEIGMVAALWGAHYVGCEISSAPLSSYFTINGQRKNLNELKKKCLEADGFLFCTPVYFGDRSSLINDFIEFVRSDHELRNGIEGKVMAGVSVGAKRNGGQETTLIYQILDMTNLGMLGVGNDSETTSQYGGTLHAGDIGTAADDEYGINTAIGTGRRVGRVTREIFHSDPKRLIGKLRVMFWILQDNEGKAAKQVQNLVADYGDGISAEILNLSKSKFCRCIACDICPTDIGPDAVYRCINKGKNDQIRKIHERFLDQDLIIAVVYSALDRNKLSSAYQKFLERTRYLRRGDYLFTDTPVMPLVFEELGAGENMHIRILTSIIRHHTIMMKSNICYIHKGEFLNYQDVVSTWHTAIDQAKKIAVGRMTLENGNNHITYKPVGYILSSTKDKEISINARRKILQEDRRRRRIADKERRLLKS